jgi:hypothetical protein
LVLFGFLERYETTKVEIEGAWWNSAGLLPTLWSIPAFYGACCAFP